MSSAVFASSTVARNAASSIGRPWPRSVFADALAPGAVSVAAGEVGEHAGGLDEADVSAAADDGVSKCLCHVGPDADGSVEDD